MATGTIKSTGWKLLWTNPNPSVAFPAQTISLDLSNYAEFVVKVYQWKDDGEFSGQVYILGFQKYNYNIFTPIITSGQVYLAGRQIITKTNGVEVTNGGSKTTLTGNFVQDNGWIVPAEIWAR